ncbi:MAG: hypothetical protein R3325_12925 [Thermoanaerobaculia bacterium]|nr:hypothetical protein [Thermoanaerobaculia bacterium]
MTRPRYLSIAAPALAFLVAVPGAVRAAEPPRDVFDRVHRLDSLTPEAAEALARAACRAEERDTRCRIRSAAPDGLVIVADAESHAGIAAALAEAERLPDSQLFHVVLLHGGDQETGDRAALPEGARRALETASGLLPYSGYRLVGTALVRTDARGRSTLDGPDGASYSASLTYNDSMDLDGHRLVVRQFSLHRLTRVQREGGVAVEEVPLLGTSFRMQPGDTVVVGTAGTGGGAGALVVLLTSVG